MLLSNDSLIWMIEMTLIKNFTLTADGDIIEGVEGKQIKVVAFWVMLAYGAQGWVSGTLWAFTWEDNIVLGLYFPKDTGGVEKMNLTDTKERLVGPRGKALRGYLSDAGTVRGTVLYTLV